MHGYVCICCMFEFFCLTYTLFLLAVFWACGSIHDPTGSQFASPKTGHDRGSGGPSIRGGFFFFAMASPDWKGYGTIKSRSEINGTRMDFNYLDKFEYFDLFWLFWPTPLYDFSIVQAGIELQRVTSTNIIQPYSTIFNHVQPCSTMFNHDVQKVPAIFAMECVSVCVKKCYWSEKSTGNPCNRFWASTSRLY